MPFKDYLVDKAASSLDPFYFDDELIPFYAWLVTLFFKFDNYVPLFMIKHMSSTILRSPLEYVLCLILNLIFVCSKIHEWESSCWFY